MKNYVMKEYRRAKLIYDSQVIRLSEIAASELMKSSEVIENYRTLMRSEEMNDPMTADIAYNLIADKLGAEVARKLRGVTYRNPINGETYHFKTNKDSGMLVLVEVPNKMIASNTLIVTEMMKEFLNRELNKNEAKHEELRKNTDYLMREYLRLNQEGI